MGSSQYIPVDVICQGCGGRFHETTPMFDPKVPTDGTMITLKQEYVEMSWSSFPEITDAVWGWLECPGCSYPYVDDDTGVVHTAKRVPVLRAKPVTVKVAPNEELVNKRNETILRMMEEGKSPAEISEAIGMSRKRTVTLMKNLKTALEA